jgi:spoIIIJ-associated protein
MKMKRIEADTLEEAYSKAAKELSCSVTEINYEIVQHPTTGVMGLFKKTAIIVAARKSNIAAKAEEAKIMVKPRKGITAVSKKEIIEKEVTTKEISDNKSEEKEIEKVVTKETPVVKDVLAKKEEIVDNFFSKSEESTEKTKVVEPVEEVIFDDDRDTPENRERSIEIERKIQHLMKVACFEIDTVEVDVFNGIAHIFIDGEDAALLIGKEGYRYNALSYMLFNWINARYDLYIKLEIAEFIQAQEEMIDNYLKPIAAHIEEHGKGKTKPLDGILVQIALEKLRAMFPNKYIAIKTGKDGKKFIIINNFNTRKSN